MRGSTHGKVSLSGRSDYPGLMDGGGCRKRSLGGPALERMEIESTILRDEDKLFTWGRLRGELSSKQPRWAGGGGAWGTQGRGLPGWLRPPLGPMSLVLHHPHQSLHVAVFLH